MTKYKEILRLHGLGLNNTRIAESCGCARSTVISTLRRAGEQGISWEDVRGCGETDVAAKLFPTASSGRQYKMPDYEIIHRELQRPGVTLSLLWVEYCDECRAAGELPYQSTQFNKYYADYVHKTKANMHLEHRPGETMRGLISQMESGTLRPGDRGGQIGLPNRIADGQRLRALVRLQPIDAVGQRPAPGRISPRRQKRHRQHPEVFRVQLRRAVERFNTFRLIA